MLGLDNNLARGGVLSSGFENNYSVDFDGSTNYLNTQNTFQTIIRSGIFSIGCWIKPDDGIPAGANYFFGCRDADSPASVISGFVETGMFPGYIQVHFNIGGNQAIWQSANAVFSDGAVSDYVHIVAVFDGSLGEEQIYCYKDGVSLGAHGVFDGDTSSLTTGDYTSSQPLYFGAYNNNGTPGDWYDGHIDEMSVWAKTLSQAECETLYNSGNGPIDLNGASAPSKLEGWYRVEEGTGTTVNDSSDNGVAGVLSHDDFYSTTVPG